MKNTHRFIQRPLYAFTVAALAGTSFMSVTALANGAEKVERIEVTGSRIKRSDIEGPSPVQSISRADID